MNSVFAYPVLITPSAGGFLVYVPDLSINTSGQNLPEAIRMARDAIGVVGIDILEDGEELPEPSTLEEVKDDSSIATLVDVDFGSYQRGKIKRKIKSLITV